jgi:hypothetical protein
MAYIIMDPTGGGMIGTFMPVKGRSVANHVRDKVTIRVDGKPVYDAQPYTQFRKANGDGFNSAAEVAQYVKDNYALSSGGGGGGDATYTAEPTTTPEGNITGFSGMDVIVIILSGLTLVKGQDFTKEIEDDGVTWPDASPLPGNTTITVLYKIPE